MDKGYFEYQNLYAGNAEVIRKSVILAKGTKIVVGAVLGMISSTREVVWADIKRTDSAKTAYAISVTECDATDAAKEIVVDLTGEFNERMLKFAPDNTAADHEFAARQVGLIFKKTVSK